MRRILTLFTLVFLAGAVWAQPSTYTLTPFLNGPGNPGGLNNEADNVTPAGWNSILPGFLSANQWSAPQTIPFAFNFFGQPVTQFKVSANGLLTFDVASTVLPNNNEPLPSTNLPDNTICGLWDEFSPSPPTGSNDQVYVKEFGTPPNRQLWVKWFSFEMASKSFIYLSIVLEEGTNNVYVVHMFTASTPPTTSTVGVQFNSGLAVEHSNNYDIGGLNSPNTDNNYFEFAPLSLVPDDAGIVSIDAPTSLPAGGGNANLQATIGNFGTNALNNATISWSVNGSTPTNVGYTGPLAPLGTDGPLSLGAFTFPVGTSTIEVWSSSPNGTTDSNPSNDTLSLTLCTPLSGTYTISQTNPAADYPDFTSAVDQLNLCGVGGPVVFQVDSGLYTENLELMEVSGASATNTITFQGIDTSATGVLGTGDGSAAFFLNGADHINFKNLTIAHSSTNDGYGIMLQSQATFISVDSCRFILPPNSGIYTAAINASGSFTSVFTDGDHFSHLSVTNSEIFRGEYGIALNGISDANQSPGLVIDNCQFTEIEAAAIYLDQVDSAAITNNVIRSSQGGSDGLNFLDVSNLSITSNEIEVQDIGMDLNDINFNSSVSVVTTSLIANNLISSQTDEAADFDDFENVDVLYNTFYSVGGHGMYINDPDVVTIINNIFVSEEDHAVDLNDGGTGLVQVDYNLYYTPPNIGDFVLYGFTTYADLPAWQAGVPGSNVNSREGDPFFVNAPDNLRILGGPNANGGAFAFPLVTEDIDGDPRDPATPDIGADEYTPIGDDARPLALVEPLGNTCGDSSQNFAIALQSVGVNLLTSVPVVVEITDPNGGGTTLSATYSGSLDFIEVDTLDMGTYNTYLGGLYDITIITNLSGDGDLSNDTLNTSVFISGFQDPAGVAVENPVLCLGDSTILVGDNGEGWRYGWYTDTTGGGSLIAATDSFFTGPITQDTTFWLGFSASGDLETTFDDNNGCGGGNMFDVTASGGTDIAITGFDINLGVGGTQNVEVYFIPQGTYVGNETNAAAWTQVGTGPITVQSQGITAPTFVELPSSIVIPSGQTYAIYVFFEADYTNGSFTYTNSDLTIETGVGLCSLFGGVNDPRSFNGRVYYTIDACNLARTPILVQVDSTPVVADYLTDISGPTVNFTSNSSGKFIQHFWDFGNGFTTTQVNPTFTFSAEDTFQVCLIVTDTCGDTDTLCQDIAVCERLVPGFLSSTTGLEANFTDNSSGTPVNWTWDFGDGGTSTMQNPDYTYSVGGTYDVTLIVTNTCGETDTITQQVNVVCPAPDADFGFTSSGQFAYDFDNDSDGGDTYLWDFGDGTTSTDENPSHTFPSAGNYTVCLTITDECGTDSICQDVIATSLTTQQVASLEIFPNPTKHDLHVRGEVADSHEVTLTLYNAWGQQVLRRAQATLGGELDAVLDLSDLSEGVYTLQLEADGKRLSRRVMRQ